MLAVRQRSGFCSFVKSVAKSVRPILRVYFFRQTKKRPTSGATAYCRKIKHTPPPTGEAIFDTPQGKRSENRPTVLEVRRAV